MKIEEYKEMIITDELMSLEKELKYINSVREISREIAKTFEVEYRGTLKPDKKVGIYEIDVPWQSTPFEFEVFVKADYNRVRYAAKNSKHVHFSLGGVLREEAFPTLKTYNTYFVSHGEYDARKTEDNIIKKWTKYFDDLEKQLENYCGIPLQEISLNNYSEQGNQMNGTVFKGPKGSVITWATVSGGYNIQRKHLRFYWKPLTDRLRKQFDIYDI